MHSHACEHTGTHKTNKNASNQKWTLTLSWILMVRPESLRIVYVWLCVHLPHWKTGSGHGILACWRRYLTLIPRVPFDPSHPPHQSPNVDRRKSRLICTRILSGPTPQPCARGTTQTVISLEPCLCRRLQAPEVYPKRWIVFSISKELYKKACLFCNNTVHVQRT